VNLLSPLTDTHCHLNLKQFDEDLEIVLERALESKVERILVPGVDLSTSQRAIHLSEKHPNIFAAVGVHPNMANSWNSDTIKEIASLCQHPKVVAIGEIGLDFYRDYANPEMQIDIFQAQLAVAANMELPVIIHNRKSFQDLWPILTNWYAGLASKSNGLATRPGVLHAFEESLASAQQAVSINFKIGICGAITFPTNVSLVEIVNSLPLQSFLIETDAPYITPHPYRGKRNEPANVKFIVEKIADISNINYKEVAAITSRNAERLFLWRASL
jgi:TatD DNase family protein